MKDYTKTVDVDGRKIHEQWTAAGKKSEVFEIIDNRFAVTVSGSGVDMDTALQALQSVDVAKLAQLILVRGFVVGDNFRNGWQIGGHRGEQRQRFWVGAATNRSR